MTKQNRKKRYRAEVIKAFKKNNNGKLIEYKVGESFYSTSIESIEYLKTNKFIK